MASNEASNEASHETGRPAMSAMLSIDVCYALPDRQTLISLQLPPGATLEQAIGASGILERHPDIDLAKQKVGVFGKLKPLDTVLADHDRVEIYRPLIVDPKLARQRRVEKTRRDGSIEGRKWLPKDSR
jgi:hypothetical protein